MSKRALTLATLFASLFYLSCSSSDNNVLKGTTNAQGRNTISAECVGTTTSTGTTKIITCTGESEYYACLQAACGSSIKTCYGDVYTTGIYSGSCGTLMTCLLACPCTATEKTTCETQCYAAMSTECSSCAQTAGACMENAICKEPVCDDETDTGTGTGTGSSVGTGSGTANSGNCALLQTCCNSIADASSKSACNSALTAYKNNDTSCKAALDGYKTAKVCN